MLQPKKTRYRKFQKGRTRGVASNLTHLAFGDYAIRSQQCARISATTLEAVRRVITRTFKRMGHLWIRVYPDIGVSQKPAEVRMGKAKGAVSFWVCRVKKGDILFEFDGVPLELAITAFRLVQYKLAVATVFEIRDTGVSRP